MAVMTIEDASTVLATVPLCRQGGALSMGLTQRSRLTWPDFTSRGSKIEVSIEHQAYLLDIPSKEEELQEELSTGQKVMLFLVFVLCN